MPVTTMKTIARSVSSRRSCLPGDCSPKVSRVCTSSRSTSLGPPRKSSRNCRCFLMPRSRAPGRRPERPGPCAAHAARLALLLRRPARTGRDRPARAAGDRAGGGPAGRGGDRVAGRQSCRCPPPTGSGAFPADDSADGHDCRRSVGGGDGPRLQLRPGPS